MRNPVPWILAMLLTALPLQAAQPATAPSGPQPDLQAASIAACATVPSTQLATDFSEKGLRSLFYTGAAYHGKTTRVFAWYGVPADLQPGQKVPAIVLVHGGGGTAFANWVRMWNARGYAAIAMDTCGHVPKGKGPNWTNDNQGGPPGWGGLDQLDEPITDQWPCHAVLDVIAADSLIRSFPEVDVQHVGITGISWGGYLTCLTTALDSRFEFAIPVYGCGYLGEDSAWVKNFTTMGPEKASRWLDAWDPSHYLPLVQTPLLWVDSTNDVNYPLEILAKSYVLPKGPGTLVTIVGMKHSHPAGWAPPEIAAFADSFCKQSAPLPKVTLQKAVDGNALATFTSETLVDTAVLNYTTDSTAWKLRKWQSVPAEIDVVSGTLSAAIPPGATGYFFHLTDHRQLHSSSKLAIIP